MGNSKYSSIKALYSAMAYIVFNVLIVFVLLNIVLAVYYAATDKKTTAAKEDMFPMSMYDTAAFELPLPYIQEINTDFNNLTREDLYYQPWVQYCEPLFKGKHLNIVTDVTGLPMRYTAQVNNPNNYPVYKVYTLGGSTTFGYNVGDEHTYPYYLARTLNNQLSTAGKQMHVEVMNYGHGYYSPSEELALLIDLLKLGHRPSMVVFMDGLNLGQTTDVPFCTPAVLDRFYKVKTADNSTLEKYMPVLRLAKNLRKKLDKTDEAHTAFWQDDERGNIIDKYVNRFAQDKDLAKRVCAQYNIPCLFFSQPVAPYNYDTTFFSHQPETEPGQRENWNTFFGKLLSANKDIIPLHHLFAAYHKKAIVDYTHYSPAFYSVIADTVAAYIKPDTLAAHPFKLDTTANTGLPRHYAEQIETLTRQLQKHK